LAAANFRTSSDFVIAIVPHSSGEWTMIIGVLEMSEQPPSF
jgi:hypothetical protein